MSILIMKPENFNEVKFQPIGLGMNKAEYENHAAWRLNQHIKTNTPFDLSIKSERSHQEMVIAGWLNDLGNNYYTLTRKSLGLLWIMFGKE